MEILDTHSVLDTRRLFLNEEYGKQPEDWDWLSQWCRDEYPADRWGYASSYFLGYLTAMYSLFPKQMRSMPIDEQRILEVEKADLADVLREGNAPLYTRKLAELKLCFPNQRFEIPHEISAYWNAIIRIFEGTDYQRLTLPGMDQQPDLLACIKIIDPSKIAQIRLSCRNKERIEQYMSEWSADFAHELRIDNIISLKILGLGSMIPADLTADLAHIDHMITGQRFMKDGIGFCKWSLKPKLLNASKISFGSRPGFVITPDESIEYEPEKHHLPTLKKYLEKITQDCIDPGRRDTDNQGLI